MPFPNPLIRHFLERTTEKAFDKGLLWGTMTGVFVTHFYKEDQYKKLETKYYDLKYKSYLEVLEKYNKS